MVLGILAVGSSLYSQESTAQFSGNSDKGILAIRVILRFVDTQDVFVLQDKPETTDPTTTSEMVYDGPIVPTEKKSLLLHFAVMDLQGNFLFGSHSSDSLMLPEGEYLILCLSEDDSIAAPQDMTIKVEAKKTTLSTLEFSARNRDAYDLSLYTLQD